MNRSVSDRMKAAEFTDLFCFGSGVRYREGDLIVEIVGSIPEDELIRVASLLREDLAGGQK